MLLMHLLHCLAFYFRFQFHVTHVPGIQDSAADALSSNNNVMLLSTSVVPQDLHAGTDLLISAGPQQARLDELV